MKSYAGVNSILCKKSKFCNTSPAFGTTKKVKFTYQQGKDL